MISWPLLTAWLIHHLGPTYWVQFPHNPLELVLSRVITLSKLYPVHCVTELTIASRLLNWYGNLSGVMLPLCSVSGVGQNKTLESAMVPIKLRAYQASIPLTVHCEGCLDV